MTDKATEIARTAVLEIAEPDTVGEFLKLEVIDGFRVFRFASTHAGYVDWRWSCSMSSESETINEVWMEPGPDSLVAKPWVPWSARIQPGDLEPGDVVATDPDDLRLMPGYAAITEDELVEELSPTYWEIGLGRQRTLSTEGVADAVYRWREGDHGPRTQFARYADLPCSSCGWLMTIGGRLGQAFGVCANPISPSDGRVVTMDHGCGAHSETIVEAPSLPVSEIVIDEFGHYEIDRAELQLNEEADSSDDEAGLAEAEVLEPLEISADLTEDDDTITES